MKYDGSNSKGGKPDGEYSGVGSKYSLDFDERMNKANTRNTGPTRSSPEKGSVAMVTTKSRKTGRVSG